MKVVSSKFHGKKVLPLAGKHGFPAMSDTELDQESTRFSLESNGGKMQNSYFRLQNFSSEFIPSMFMI